jgi:hypothetical protein
VTLEFLLPPLSIPLETAHTVAATTKEHPMSERQDWSARLETVERRLAQRNRVTMAGRWHRVGRVVVRGRPIPLRPNTPGRQHGDAMLTLDAKGRQQTIFIANRDGGANLSVWSGNNRDDNYVSVQAVPNPLIDIKHGGRTRVFRASDQGN